MADKSNLDKNKQKYIEFSNNILIFVLLSSTDSTGGGAYFIAFEKTLFKTCDVIKK